MKAKTIVLGMRERGGRVRAFVVPDAKRRTLLPRIAEHIEPGSTVYTDAHPTYRTVSQDYIHRVIDHSVAYVQGRVHTNNIECFWSVLRRTLRGTYIAPRPKHLDRYLDEHVFRFNAREESDGPRFRAASKGADGKRLTYKRLTGKEQATLKP